MQAAAPGSLDKYGYDWNSAVTTQALPGVPVKVVTPSVKAATPAAETPITSTDWLTMPGLTSVNAAAMTSTKATSLQADLVAAQAAASSGSATPAQQARNLLNIEAIQNDIAREDAKLAAQAAKNQQAALGDVENQILGNTGNRADEFSGVKPTGAPAHTAENTATTEAWNGTSERTDSQKAADVGEQPITPHDKGSLVGSLHASTAPSRELFVEQLNKLMMRNPDAMGSFHPEIQSFYSAYQKTLHSQYGYRPQPNPSAPDYEGAMKSYEVWSSKKKIQADLAGLNAAYSYYSAQTLASPIAELGKKALSGLDAIDVGDPNAMTKAELQYWVNHAVPKAYQDAPSYLEDISTGEALARGIDTFTPVGVLTAADDVAKALQKTGMPKNVQVIGARIAIAIHAAAGPAAKLGLKEGKASLKALSTAIKQRFDVDLSQLTSRELESIVQALGEKGIQMTADGTVKGVVDMGVVNNEPD